jgi:hypothetical protein
MTYQYFAQLSMQNGQNPYKTGAFPNRSDGFPQTFPQVLRETPFFFKGLSG